MAFESSTNAWPPLGVSFPTIVAPVPHSTGARGWTNGGARLYSRLGYGFGTPEGLAATHPLRCLVKRGGERARLDAGRPSGEALSAISNGLAQLHLRFFGRGPSKTKAIVVDDLVVCVLWDGFTVVEQTLLRRGEKEAVEAFRRTFQSTMEPQFSEVVE